VPDGLRLALTTFTVLPARGDVVVDRRSAGTAMALAPALGLLLGAAAAAPLALATDAPLLGAVLAVALLALLTRGLHLDGLVDTVDGLASYRPAEQALRIMRSPEAGPLGVAALGLVLLAQVAALASCAEQGRGAVAVVLAVATGRLAVTLACGRGVPAASPTGLGAAVAGSVARPVAAAAVAAVLVVAVAAGLLDGDLPLWLGPLAVVAALAVAALLRRHAVRRLGGVTGDVLGSVVEAATTVALVVLALG
jgi:adenosylcobinamide-GDP ribazoletransferase